MMLFTEIFRDQECNRQTDRQDYCSNTALYTKVHHLVKMLLVNWTVRSAFSYICSVLKKVQWLSSRAYMGFIFSMFDQCVFEICDNVLNLGTVSAAALELCIL